jgi:hypothetical protein
MYNARTMFTRKCLASLVFMAAVVLAPTHARAQAANPEISVDEIIRRFSEKEKEFKTARDNYTFRQEVIVQTLGSSDRVTGEYRATTEISFDEKGRRTERVVHAPPSTLKAITMTAEDFQDIESIQPFVLTSDDIGLYNLKFGGKETVDEITAYVFDVSPKKIEKGKRYFEGKIWVDDQDFQIVKTYGKPVPDLKTNNGENLFPKFETYREQIDGVYWFPTYTRAIDTLKFSTGSVKIREIVRYGDYKKFQSSIQLKFGGEVKDDKAAPAGTTPEKDKNLAPVLDPRFKTEPKTDPKSAPIKK